MASAQEDLDFRARPLVARLKPVVTKRAGLALGLWGEAGIGKTYTAKQLLSRISCRSLSLPARTSPGSLAGTLPRPTRLPLWTTRLLESLERGEHAEDTAVVNALAALLASLSPVILHLEDLHEATPEQLELWRGLAESAARTRGVCLLATTRTLPPEPFEPLRLEPLGAQASQLLLEVEVGTALPLEATAWIYTQALGNPLFTLEYFRYLSRRGHLWNDRERWHWRAPASDVLPTTVEALIERLLDDAATSQEVRDGLEARAILPAAVSKSVWAEVAALSADVLAKVQRELERWGIMSGGEFSHPLFGEVAARSLSLARKRELARRALAALGEDVQMAASFVADAGLETEKAIWLLRRAAADARRRTDRVRAAKLLVEAVSYASGATKAQLAPEAARAVLDTGNPGVQPLLEDALPLLEDQSEALLMLAEAYALEGRPLEMEGVLARLPKSVRKSPAWLERYLRLLFTSGAQAEVIAVWEAHPKLHKEASPSTIYYVAYTLMDRGDLRSARALAEARLAQGGLDTYGRTELLDICAGVAFYQGDYQQAEALFSEVLALYRQHSRGWDEVANALRNRALNRLQLGQYRESLPDLKESLQLYAERGKGVFYAQTLVMISDVYIELGDYEQAEEVLREALEVFERIKPQPFLINCLANLVYLYLDWQPPYSRLLASKYGESCLSFARELDSARHEAVAAGAASRAATLAGNPTRGLELAEEAVRLAGELGFHDDLIKARLAHALALKGLGRRAEALETLSKALQAAQAQHMVVEANKIGLELDRLTGDLESARTRLAWFEARGLGNGANLARRYFPDLAEPTFQTTPARVAQSRLDVLGPMQFFQAGVSQPVRGEKRKELLAYLLEARIAGRPEVSQLELLDTLYPGLPEEEAADALKQVVYATRKALGTAVIARTGSGYSLGAVTSDAELFLQKGEALLWRGNYLEDVGMSWRDSVQLALNHALREKVRKLVETNPHEGAKLGKLLMKAEPYDLEALRLTMQAMRASNNHRSLVRIYNEGRERLSEVGEALPESWGNFLITFSPAKMA